MHIGQEEIEYVRKKELNVIKGHNLNWLQVSDHPYKILIIGNNKTIHDLY